MSYKKFGRLHFVRFGRFGFSFFSSRKRKQLTPAQQQRALSRAANLDRLTPTGAAAVIAITTISTSSTPHGKPASPPPAASIPPPAHR